ncbi:hypothetical protein SAMN05443575_2370 [Jatrophihabitans endophyticus]|uniref:Uncharacterized protein n=1 Tax=Jatrophihabitans endophyticus TaxID=1206085 RepID=A0A1M5L6P0_9ACTN|nr:hypothetical protein [Jatrophihabitans endophyticus]SHG60772.1 hypothetical protein SAMN05443575_2370 [Jatrophihabitans endophyticus]
MVLSPERIAAVARPHHYYHHTHGHGGGFFAIVVVGLMLLAIAAFVGWTKIGARRRPPFGD